MKFLSDKKASLTNIYWLSGMHRVMCQRKEYMCFPGMKPEKVQVSTSKLVLELTYVLFTSPLHFSPLSSFSHRLYFCMWPLLPHVFHLHCPPAIFKQNLKCKCIAKYLKFMWRHKSFYLLMFHIFNILFMWTPHRV